MQLTQTLALVRKEAAIVGWYGIFLFLILTKKIFIHVGMDNPDALRRYYNLLLSVIRVIVSVVFARGLHNEQTMEQTRAFLAENRSSMVGIFKRFSNAGGREATADIEDVLGDLTKSYMALITATDFLMVSEFFTCESRSI